VERCNDAEIMRIWRECGLPEFFLGNGGTNGKLCEFAKRVADKWISVDDHPPGEGVDVVIAHYAPGCISDNLIQSMTSTAAYITKHPERFTHWMPLPDPPTDNAVPAKENIQ
jgi:hypothetical protein